MHSINYENIRAKLVQEQEKSTDRLNAWDKCKEILEEMLDTNKPFNPPITQQIYLRNKAVNERTEAILQIMKEEGGLNIAGILIAKKLDLNRQTLIVWMGRRVDREKNCPWKYEKTKSNFSLKS